MEQAVFLVVFIIFGIFSATSIYPYLVYGDGDRQVYGIERVIGFLFWPIVIPAAILRLVTNWLFTKH